MIACTRNLKEALHDVALIAAFCLALLIAASSQGQSTTCPGPTPGSPHVCLKWTDSTTAGTQTNIYRATAPGGENYGAPLNTTPLAVGTTAYYDTTVATGTTYYYTAAAFLVVGSGPGGVLSPPTPEVSVQTPVPPNPVTNFTASPD